MIYIHNYETPKYLSTCCFALRFSNSFATAQGTHTLLTGFKNVLKDFDKIMATGIPTIVMKRAII
ncbi:hypothetical protein [Ochrovirga pacifica]|uniref:hypothetical protein n=1 Tax=Ochrovirga pacifica TaxID=1042376 RepID=UPI0002557FF8|nr:hypothetical protein [Ochrovirga pacifica]